jgi:iron complex outermembrane receptor protein
MVADPCGGHVCSASCRAAAWQWDERLERYSERQCLLTARASVPGGFGCAQRCLYDFTFVAADEAEQRNELAVHPRLNYRDQRGLVDLHERELCSRVKSFGRYAPVPSSPWLDGGAAVHPGGLAQPPGRCASRTPATMPSRAGTSCATASRRSATVTRPLMQQRTITFDCSAAEGRTRRLLSSTSVCRRCRVQVLSSSVATSSWAAIAQQFIADGATTSTPRSANPREVLDAMIATINRDGGTSRSKSCTRSGQHVDLFEMAGGAAGVAFGAEFRDGILRRRLRHIAVLGPDRRLGRQLGGRWPQRRSAAFLRSAAAGARRTWKFNSRRATTEYSDYGNDTSPKVSVRWSAAREPGLARFGSARGSAPRRWMW